LRNKKIIHKRVRSIFLNFEKVYLPC